MITIHAKGEHTGERSKTFVRVLESPLGGPAAVGLVEKLFFRHSRVVSVGRKQAHRLGLWSLDDKRMLEGS